jgi:UDP-N-acetylglucosamine--N-acetylmuramyl-(pentapeptide) pyrophosphoryl-undecaprenol N-acetylglucosamine transferase
MLGRRSVASMSGQEIKNVILVGGGTLGPVTPLLGLAEKWAAQNKGITFHWIGTEAGPEREFVNKAGMEFFVVASGKLPRYWSLEIFVWPAKIWRGFWQSRQLLQDLHADLVVGAGAYVAVPVCLAARSLNIPIALHQQDKRLGLANRILWPFANLKTSVWPRGGALTIGNFSRRQIEGAEANRVKNQLSINSARPVILVTGGGTGARDINQLVSNCLPELLAVAEVIHLTGRGKEISATAPGYHQQAQAFAEMGDMYAAATIIVSRAGLATLSDAAFMKKPVIVIPMPGSHQEDNAAWLAERGAIINLTGDLTKERLLGVVKSLLGNTQQQQQLGAALHASIPDGRTAFIKEAEKLIK